MARKSAGKVKQEVAKEDHVLEDADGGTKKRVAKKIAPLKKTLKQELPSESGDDGREAGPSPKKTKKRKSIETIESPTKEKKGLSNSALQPFTDIKMSKKKKLPNKKGGKKVKKSDEQVKKEGDLVLEDDVLGSDDDEDAETPKKRKQFDPLEDAERNSRTIFVGNLPKDFDAAKIKQMFKKCGPVDTLRIRCAPVADPRVPKKVAVIKKDFHESRSSISAFVVFKSEDTVPNALALNGSIVQGHHIRVDTAVKQKKFETNRAVFLGNLPFGVEDEKLWDTFSSCGEIESVHIIRDKRTGLGKGIGYVNFKKSDAVELALMKNEIKIGKNIIRVNRCGDTTSKRKKNAINANKRMAFKTKKAENRANAEKIKKKKNSKKADSENSFQGQKVISGKVQKKEKKVKLNPKKKLVVESLAKSIKTKSAE
ncbi:RNA-binding protein 34 isoform X2 [Neocloeon triangulifer]|uniref:RNA-binding protein 34 isoform X2 n=1 Tax=Neocloeon triangulifer TaxID=2078957 RepID=UPI00286EE08A|nr:RNA-binding protein 34 isoform X2 [Neocloeon triangulifer]